MSRKGLLLFAAVLVTGPITGPGAEATGAGKFRLVIEETGSVSSFQGRFALYGPTGSDSGTSSIRVQISPVRYRDGQRYEIHSGKDTMHSKKGGLTLSFSGASVNAGPSLYITYGTWHISGASGIYKGWKGGGNFGNTDNEQTYHFQWEGLITR